MTPSSERSGAGGRTCRARPGGKHLGGNCLGGLVWVWVGLAWARYFALSLPTAAAAAAAGEAPLARAGFFPRLRGVLGVAAWQAEAMARPAGVAAATPRAPSSLSFAAVAAAGEAPVARAGSVPRFRGVLGVAAWSAEAVARPAGAAVATPRAPFSLSSAAAAALGDAPRSCAGATPRVGGVPGAAFGAAAWLAGAAASAFCASGAPSRGATAGLAAWAAGAVTSAGSGSRAGGGGPTSTAASASLRSSRSTRVSPVHSGEAGERERDQRWWRSSRWEEPSESAIVVVAGAPFPLPPGASVPCRGQCRVVLCGGEGGGVVGLGWVKASPGRLPTVRAAFPAGPDRAAVPGCPVTRPTGLLTAPRPRGGARGREMPPCLCVCALVCLWRGGGGCGTPACSIVVRRWRTWCGEVCAWCSRPRQGGWRA